MGQTYRPGLGRAVIELLRGLKAHIEASPPSPFPPSTPLFRPTPSALHVPALASAMSRMSGPMASRTARAAATAAPSRSDRDQGRRRHDAGPRTVRRRDGLGGHGGPGGRLAPAPRVPPLPRADVPPDGRQPDRLLPRAHTVGWSRSWPSPAIWSTAACPSPRTPGRVASGTPTPSGASRWRSVVDHGEAARRVHSVFVWRRVLPRSLRARGGRRAVRRPTGTGRCRPCRRAQSRCWTSGSRPGGRSGTGR